MSIIGKALMCKMMINGISKSKALNRLNEITVDEAVIMLNPQGYLERYSKTQAQDQSISAPISREALEWLAKNGKEII